MINSVIKKSIEYPLILSNNEYAHLLLILNDYRDSPEYKNWFIQNFFNIYVVKRDFSEFENVICFLPDIQERVLEKCPFIHVDYLSSDDVTDIVSEMKGWIDAGKFVILPLNKFYLPSASEYQKMEITHRVLLYGYDEEAETFEAADMFKLTGYMLEPVKYEDFVKAYSSSVPMKQNGCSDIEIISHLDANCSLDVQGLKEKMAQYITQNETYDNSTIFQALERSLKQEDYLDEISCNVLFEYQRIITRKAELMNDRKLIQLEKAQLQEFYDLEVEMKQFRNYFIKYRIKNKISPQVEEKNKLLHILKELHRKHIKLYHLLLETIK